MASFSLRRIEQQITSSAVCVRTLPFAVFLGFTVLQGSFGESSRYWIYLIKTLVGAWLVWKMRAFVAEMRWRVSWEAVLVGVAVCAMWVGIDGLYPHFGSAKPWNPLSQFAGRSWLAYMFVGIRLAGSALVVPPLEEVFYRSWLYRYWAQKDFQAMPLGRFHAISFVITSLVFGLEHYQWLAGILCGFAYQGLVMRKNRLGDAITAHAITNLLLGLWVYWQQDWRFW